MEGKKEKGRKLLEEEGREEEGKKGGRKKGKDGRRDLLIYLLYRCNLVAIQQKHYT